MLFQLFQSTICSKNWNIRRNNLTICFSPVQRKDYTPPQPPSTAQPNILSALSGGRCHETQQGPSSMDALPTDLVESATGGHPRWLKILEPNMLRLFGLGKYRSFIYRHAWYVHTLSCNKNIARQNFEKTSIISNFIYISSVSVPYSRLAEKITHSYQHPKKKLSYLWTFLAAVLARHPNQNIWANCAFHFGPLLTPFLWLPPSPPELQWSRGTSLLQPPCRLRGDEGDRYFFGFKDLKLTMLLETSKNWQTLGHIWKLTNFRSPAPWKHVKTDNVVWAPHGD